MKLTSNKPVFSFIIPTLNEEQCLPRLLDSLTCQQERDYEVIIVDAHSTDKTITLAKAHRSSLPFLTLITAKKANAASQRNQGAEIARGEWLIFVDADTELLPNFLLVIQSYIAKIHPVFFSTWLKTDEKGLLNLFLTIFMNISYEFLRVIGRPMSPGPLTVIRKETFYSVGRYDELRQYGEDYDLSLRAVKQQVQFHLLPQIVHVMSFRRMRRNGYLKMAALYLWTTMSAAITGHVTPSVKGYTTGGQIYHS